MSARGKLRIGREAVDVGHREARICDGRLDRLKRMRRERLSAERVTLREAHAAEGDLHRFSHMNAKRGGKGVPGRIASHYAGPAHQAECGNVISSFSSRTDLHATTDLRLRIRRIQQIAGHQRPRRLVELDDDARVRHGRSEALVARVIHDRVRVDRALPSTGSNFRSTFMQFTHVGYGGCWKCPTSGIAAWRARVHAPHPRRVSTTGSGRGSAKSRCSSHSREPECWPAADMSSAWQPEGGFGYSRENDSLSIGMPPGVPP